MQVGGKIQFFVYNVIIILGCVFYGASYMTIAAQWLYTVIKQYKIEFLMHFISLFVNEKLVLNVHLTNEFVDQNQEYRVCVVLTLCTSIALIGFCCKDLSKLAKISVLKTVFAIVTCVVIIYAYVTYKVCAVFCHLYL